MQQQPPVRDPISEGWMQRGAPVDYLGRYSTFCPRCQQETVQDEYRTIMGNYAGFGSPWFVRPFLRRQSTRGKVGKRSVWTICSQCGSMLPVDEEARQFAAAMGQPNGFLH
jgi:hypothetical protein